MTAHELREKIALVTPDGAPRSLPVVVAIHDEAGVFQQLPISAISFDGRRITLHASQRDAAF